MKEAATGRRLTRRWRRLFAHPLAGAEVEVVWAALRRAAPWRSSYAAPLVASALATFQRRPWIAKAEAAAAAAPADWHRERPPVFIVGFWRSGTTLLHEMLASDPGFAAPSLLDVVCPADAPFLVAGKRAFLSKALPPDRGFDAVEVAPGRPQEEEWAMAHLGAPSFFNAFYFPRLRGRLIEEALFLDGRPETREAWRAAHQRFLRLMAAKYPGRRLLVKNPANCVRLPELQTLYPEALFVRIDRRREEVLPSLMRMMDGNSERLSLQGRPPPFGEDEAERLYAQVMATLDADWAALPAKRRARIRYKRLLKAPAEITQGVYASLGLPLTDEAQSRQARYWRRRGRKRKPFAKRRD